MNHGTASSEELDELSGWLEKAAAAMKVRAIVHRHLAKQEGEWIYLPVRIEGQFDAYDRVGHLQNLEDAWNNQEPRPHWNLLLVPAAG